MESILLRVHEQVSDSTFVFIMIAIGFVISLRLIPYTTSMMVNAAGGLAGKYLGREYRTLVINCSTNNPELVTMMLALLVSGKQGIGGIGTPLGSNFANIYLIFFVALVWLLVNQWFSDRPKFYRMLMLLRRERMLVAWHVAISVVMFVCASFAFQMLTHTTPPARIKVASAIVLCVAGIVIFIWRERILRRKRPDLFHDIDDVGHVACWRRLFIGTFGLLVACYIVNAMFVVSTELYSASLARVLGNSVFAAMHYFLGALITSLPELNVAIHNYRKLTSADLNTGLSSASASNMSNLAVAGIGAVVALILLS